MNLNLTNAHREFASWFDAIMVIFIVIVCLTLSSAKAFSQGSTCSTAEPVIVHFNAGTRTANGPSYGNGAVNSCYSTSTATHAGWYKYTPKFSGHIRISSCDGGVDTRLSIFTGSCDNLVCYAFSDDSCPMSSGGSSWASNLENLRVTARTTYYIQ